MTNVLQMLAKGYTRPIISSDFPKPVSIEIVQAREVLAAKRKLTGILRSKSTPDMPINVGDLV